MPHPKCATCAHFQEPDSWDRPKDFKKCGLVQMSCDVTEYDHALRKNVLAAEFTGHLASVMDGSSYRAELHVHPDFYCPMHSSLMPHLARGA